MERWHRQRSLIPRARTSLAGRNRLGSRRVSVLAIFGTKHPFGQANPTWQSSVVPALVALRCRHASFERAQAIGDRLGALYKDGIRAGAPMRCLESKAATPRRERTVHLRFRTRRRLQAKALVTRGVARLSGLPKPPEPRRRLAWPRARPCAVVSEFPHACERNPMENRRPLVTGEIFI